MLYLIGLGINSGDISLSAYEIIKDVQTVIVRTEKTASAVFLKEKGINYLSLDNEYERSRNFNTLSKNLAEKVKSYLKSGSVAYLVDGAVSDDKSSELLIKSVKNIKIFEGVSKAKGVLSLLKITSPTYTAVSAYDKLYFSHFSYPLVIYDLDSQIICSEWKITLSDIIGDEAKVFLYNQGKIKKLSLFEIDREKKYDYRTAIVVTESLLENKKRFDFYNLIQILARLRAPNGCPWDKVQTKESIRKNLIEECYELVDAINQNDEDKIREEIGDVLMQAAFHMQFGFERGAFTYFDVTSEVCEKLIFRHSHVFGCEKSQNADEALNIWDKNKQVEKGFSTPDKYINDVPKNFPALMRIQKIIKRASKFTCKEKFDYFNYIELLINNLKEENNKNIKAEMLAALIANVVIIASENNLDAEEILSDLTDKFTSEFCENYNKDNINISTLINNVVNGGKN